MFGCLVMIIFNMKIGLIEKKNNLNRLSS